MIARPGNIVWKGAVLMNSLPALSMEPHSGISAGSPNPRKLRAATERITWPKSIVASTIIGAMPFGMICFLIMRRLLAPKSRVDSTYSCSLIESTWPLMSLAYEDHCTKDSESMRFTNPGPSTPIMARAKMIPGNARKTSIARDIISSTSPP
ncbi:MAG: hypothetical protein A4E23_00558 [Methanomethylovorans sp. PtaU1.Bin073]|nr:MAG: hypothetical protein A4E23_00558 [Methanomethylovorans sp. PtaU1.Bin073]